MKNTCSRLMIGVLGLLFASHARATAQSLANDVQVQSISCVNDASLKDASTGEKEDASFGHYTLTGHTLQWKDGARQFNVTTGEMYLDGAKVPELILRDATLNSAVAANPALNSQLTRTFYEGADNDVHLQKATYNYSALTKDGVEIDTDLDTNKKTKQPDFQVTRKAVSRPLVGSSETISKALGPQPETSAGYITTTQLTTCTFSPAKFANLNFTGFFKQAKTQILKFDQENENVLAARTSLAKCQSGGAQAKCTTQTASVSSAVTAREKLWSSLIRTSMLTPTDPVVADDGGSSGGYTSDSSDDGSPDPYGGSGGGFGGPGVCTNGVCSGPGGTSVCTNGVCSGPGGTTVCTNGVCNGPGGTTVCTNGVCTGPSGTTVCTNGVCD